MYNKRNFFARIIFLLIGFALGTLNYRYNFSALNNTVNQMEMEGMSCIVPLPVKHISTSEKAERKRKFRRNGYTEIEPGIWEQVNKK